MTIRSVADEPAPKAYRTHREVIDTLVAARDADPRESPWGVLIQDPWEDGDQQFFWYPTRHELEHALLDAHAFVDAEAFEEDQEDWHEARFDLDHALRELQELRPEDAEALDDLVNDFFCIVWLGHFADLAEGDDPIAADIRAELRGGAEHHDDAAPLQEAELEAFVALLRMFGVDDD